MSTNRLKSRRRPDQGSKWIRIVIAILATIGVIDTGSITINRWGWIGAISCPGGAEGCDKVLNSAWGTLFENNNLMIPLSMIGFIAYLSILFLSIVNFLPASSENKIKFNRNTWWGLFILSLSMSIFSLLLIRIMLFKVEAFCFFCVLSALLSISIFLLTTIGGGWDSKRDLIFPGIILSLIILLGGLFWSASVDPNSSNSFESSQGMPPAIETVSSSSSISLAKHLQKNNVVLYNAYWCPHCHEQKEMFGKEAVSHLLLVECAIDGKNSQRELCQQKGITGFPSWEINGEIQSGVKSLTELADMTGYIGSQEF
tara:strand:+ start:1220 stop:2161 length:942 start_codon:yes stop_codon:yes gene_type:complete